MSYKITIEQNPARPDDAPAIAPIKIFEQTVESLNLKAVINTINATPRKPRVAKVK